MPEGYRAERLLGRGGFGCVLLARRVADGVPAALKVANGEQRQGRARLLREIDVLRAIGPPLVPGVLEAGTLADGSHYCALEYVQLPTLAERLQQLLGPMEPNEFFGRSDAILEVLGKVHERGFVHCDLKPENIFSVDSPPQARLFDFGLVRFEGTDPAADLTIEGGFAGTAEYMSPEQCEGRMEVDGRSDVYSIGVVLYEMLTARPPFWGAQNEVHQAHLSRRPTRPSLMAPVSPEMEEVILRCLAKEPGRRFGTVADLRRALEGAMSATARESPKALGTPSATSTPRPSAQERRLMGLLFFESGQDVASLQAALASFSGQLASIAGKRAAVVFDPTTAANPVDRAVRAARALMDRGIADNALVDLAPVTGRRRRDGSIRYTSGLFARPDRYPQSTDPIGPLLTRAAADVLPEQRCEPVPQREGIFRSRNESTETVEATVVRLSGAPFIGRDDAIRSLLETAQSAIKDKRPSVFAVIGDVGLGKTRLCAELTRHLTAKLGQAQVLALRSHDPADGTAASVRAVVRSVLQLPDETAKPADGGRRLLARALGPKMSDELWPALALALGWLNADSSELKGAASAPGVLQSTMSRGLGELLRRKAFAAPTCLLLDDAHLADDVTLNALEYAALAEARCPLWVCAFARPVFEQSRPSWGERAAAEGRLHLQALTQDRAAELCLALLHPVENIPSKAIERLVDRTHGVPLLLVELVRGLKRQGIIRRNARGDSWFLATDELDHLPDLPLVEWLAHRELEGMPPELAAHAQLAALLGPHFYPDELEGVLKQLEREAGASEFPLDAHIALQRLLGIGFLVSGPRTGVRFRHALMQEEVARSMPDELRRRIHRSAFQYYQGQPIESETRHKSLLAFHAAEAGLRDKAAHYHLELANAARHRHAYVEAEGFYSRGLQFMAEADEASRLQALQGRGVMRYRVGRYSDSLNDFADAREIARRRGELASEVDLLLDEAMALDWIGQFPTSKELVDQASELMKKVSSPLLEARAQMGTGRSLYRFSRPREAAQALESALLKCTDLGDEAYETRVVCLSMLGLILPNLGRTEDAENALNAGIALCADRGDQMHLAAMLNNRHALWIAKGDVMAAVQDLERYMAIGRELGVVRLEYWGHSNTGELLYLWNDLIGAKPHVERAVEIENKHPEIVGRPLALVLSARLLMLEGQEQRAREMIVEVKTRQAQPHRTDVATGNLYPSEQILLEAIELATREATETEWEQLLERSNRDSVGMEPIEVIEMRGLSALRRGRHREAVNRFEEALQQAAKIPNIMGPRLRSELEAAISFAGPRHELIQ